MREIYSLKKDHERRKMFESIASIPDDVRQVDFPNGPLGSSQWWGALSAGSVKLHEVEGMILRFDRKGETRGSVDTFVMRGNTGPILRWQAYSNEVDAGPIFYRPGRAVKVRYAKVKVREGAKFPVAQVVSVEVDDYPAPRVEDLKDEMKCVFSAADFPHFESIIKDSKTPYGSIGSDSWWEATLAGKFKLNVTRGFVAEFEPELTQSTGANIKVQSEKGEIIRFRGFTSDDSEPKDVFVPGRRIQVLWFDATEYSKMMKGVTIVVFIDVYV